MAGSAPGLPLPTRPGHMALWSLGKLFLGGVICGDDFMIQLQWANLPNIRHSFEWRKKYRKGRRGKGYFVLHAVFSSAAQTSSTLAFPTVATSLYSGPVKSIVLSAILAASFTSGAQAAPAISLEQVAEGFVSPTALQSVPGADYML